MNQEGLKPLATFLRERGCGAQDRGDVLVFLTGAKPSLVEDGSLAKP